MHLSHPGAGSDCRLLSLHLFPPLSIIRSHRVLSPHLGILWLNPVLYLSTINSSVLNFSFY